MERRIYEAAVEGSVSSLLFLLEEDALVLDRFMVSCYAESPLHIACMLGHVEFAKEILSRKPELAGELDSRKSSPLHLAAAKGYLDIVKKLVFINPEMCFIRDRDGRNPLHIAATKGHVNVLRELVQVRPQAVRILMDRGDTILHACVKYSQLEAIRLLVEILGDREFMNSKNREGNTILHLAVADKQLEAIKFLTTCTTVEVNALNANGFTALDIVTQGNELDEKDCEIRDLLQRATALSALELETTHIKTLTSYPGNQTIRLPPQHTGSEDLHRKQDNYEWLRKKRNTLMVVASLIATMAFQVGVNPPGGLWQDTTQNHQAGVSIMADNYPVFYTRFLIFNTTGFIASLSIILLLISGLPIRSKILMWILAAIMWIAVTAITFTYLFSITSFTPSHHMNSTFELLGVVLLVWMCLMMTLLLGHAIRLLVRMIKYFRRLIKGRRSESEGSMVMNHTAVSNADNLNNV